MSKRASVERCRRRAAAWLAIVAVCVGVHAPRLLAEAPPPTGASEPPPILPRVIADGDGIPQNGGLLIDPGSFQIDRVEVVSRTGELVIPGSLTLLLGRYPVWAPDGGFLPPGQYQVTLYQNDRPIGQPARVTALSPWNWGLPPSKPLALQGELAVDVREVASEACCNLTGAQPGTPFCFVVSHRIVPWLELTFTDLDPSHYLNQFVYIIDDGAPVPFQNLARVPLSASTLSAGMVCRTVRARHILSTYETELFATCTSLAGVPEPSYESFDVTGELADGRCEQPPTGLEEAFCEAKADCPSNLSAPDCKDYYVRCTAGVGPGGEPAMPQPSMPGPPTPTPSSSAAEPAEAQQPPGHAESSAAGGMSPSAKDDPPVAGSGPADRHGMDVPDGDARANGGALPVTSSTHGDCTCGLANAHTRAVAVPAMAWFGLLCMARLGRRVRMRRRGGTGSE